MSISNNYVPVRQLGNGVTTQFSANWAVLAASYILVYLESVSTGNQVAQVLGTDFTLTFDGAGFVVTFLVAPTSANYVVIGRNVSPDQTNPYRTSKGFQGEVLEQSFDKLTALVQDLKNASDRTFKFPLGSTAIGSLPTPVDDFALVWNGTGGAIKNGPTTGQIAAASGYAAAASASATAAAASAAATAALIATAPQLLATITASNSASATFTGLGSYSRYRVDFINVHPATAGTDILARIGNSGGIKSGVSDYTTIGRITTADGASSLVNSTAGSSVQITTDIDNGANTGVTGSLYFTLNQNGVVPLRWEMSYINNTSVMADYRGSGAYIGTGITQDRIQFLHGSGNITSGVFKLYGYP